MKNEGLCLDDSYIADDLNDPEELESTWETWTPDPIDADPLSKLRYMRICQIIQFGFCRQGCRSGFKLLESPLTFLQDCFAKAKSLFIK